MESIKFLNNFIKYPNMIGAICPSSKALANKMVVDIDFESIKCIVEYGAGTGVFTEKIIERKKEHTILLVFELNESLYISLKNKYKNAKNVHIIHDSAKNINMYLKKYGFDKTDYIISGLPFAAFPQHISDEILSNSVKALRKEGRFITFQYTLLKKKFIKQFFKNIHITFELKNIPPAFIFNCSIDEENLYKDNCEKGA